MKMQFSFLCQLLSFASSGQNNCPQIQIHCDLGPALCAIAKIANLHFSVVMAEVHQLVCISLKVCDPSDSYHHPSCNSLLTTNSSAHAHKISSECLAAPHIVLIQWYIYIPHKIDSLLVLGRIKFQEDHTNKDHKVKYFSPLDVWMGFWMGKYLNWAKLIVFEIVG